MASAKAPLAGKLGTPGSKQGSPAPGAAGKEKTPAPAGKAAPAAAPAKAAPPPEVKKSNMNVMKLIPPQQIQEFKEAFALIDNNGDGTVDKNDLKAVYSMLGREPSDKELDEMLKEAPGQLNFTAFLTLFGEKMHGTDPESTLRSAFAMFDRDGKGQIPEDYLKDLLLNTGDQFTDAELKNMLKDAHIEKGVFDYNAYVTLVKRGNQDEA